METVWLWNKENWTWCSVQTVTFNLRLWPRRCRSLLPKMADSSRTACLGLELASYFIFADCIFIILTARTTQRRGFARRQALNLQQPCLSFGKSTLDATLRDHRPVGYVSSPHTVGQVLSTQCRPVLSPKSASLKETFVLTSVNQFPGFALQ